MLILSILLIVVLFGQSNHNSKYNATIAITTITTRATIAVTTITSITKATIVKITAITTIPITTITAITTITMIITINNNITKQ